MKMKIISKVDLDGMLITDEYVQEFDDKENVFGRILIYHQRMNKVFPNANFRIEKTEIIKS